jgi:hypothetical protein
MIFTLREGAHRATLPVEKANIDPWNLAGPKSDYKVIIPQLINEMGEDKVCMVILDSTYKMLAELSVDRQFLCSVG